VDFEGLVDAVHEIVELLEQLGKVGRIALGDTDNHGVVAPDRLVELVLARLCPAVGLTRRAHVGTLRVLLDGPILVREAAIQNPVFHVRHQILGEMRIEVHLHAARNLGEAVFGLPSAMTADEDVWHRLLRLGSRRGS
jgi:hypothetical protein